MPPKRRVFISYASKDREFVRRLDASLSSLGLSVFLDEREIQVGDSIPLRIFKSLAEATHIICVLSKHSAKSKWVREELDAAHMRRLSERRRPIILPVRLDSFRLPRSLSHVKYADFRDWESGSGYFAGLRQLREALGVPAKAVDLTDLEIYLKHHEAFSSAERASHFLATTVEAALDTDWVLSTMHKAPRGSGTRSVIKWNFEEGPHVSRLSEFFLLLREESPRKTGRLAALQRSIAKFLTLCFAITRTESERYEICRELRDAAFRISEIVAEFRTENMYVVAAGYGFARRDGRSGRTRSQQSMAPSSGRSSAGR